jgi:hypothetical protein
LDAADYWGYGNVDQSADEENDAIANKERKNFSLHKAVSNGKDGKAFSTGVLHNHFNISG